MNVKMDCGSCIWLPVVNVIDRVNVNVSRPSPRRHACECSEDGPRAWTSERNGNEISFWRSVDSRSMIQSLP